MRLKPKFAWAIAGLVCLAAAWSVWHQVGRPGADADATHALSQPAPEDPHAPFTLVSAAQGSLDGGPALTLSFSLPLDRTRNYDAVVDVFEMPARKGEKPKASSDDGSDAGTDTGADAGADEADDASTNAAQAADSNAEASAVSTAEADVRTDGGKRVAGSWVVGANPRLLQFPHVKPDTRYVVVAHADLTSPGNKTLGTAAHYSIRTRAMPPSFYFASNGMVLPAHQNGGLPVVTVNVPEVDVEFLRVRPAQLSRFLDRVISGPARASASDPDAPAAQDGDARQDPSHLDLHGAVYNWNLNELQSLADSVYHGRFLADDRKDRRGVTFLPVESIKELGEPGVYVAVMNQPGHFDDGRQTTYFYVTDLGLSVRQYDKRADAFVSSLTDAKPSAGVEVDWLDAKGNVLASHTTDDLGHAAFDSRPAAARVLMARKDGQLAMIPLREPALDLSEYPLTGDVYRPARLFAYSGRDLYRPGERFDVSVLLRDADGRPLPAMPVQATLRRADGRTQFVSTWRPDPKIPGVYRQSIELPVDAPTGLWSLELRTDPAAKTPGGTLAFHVEEFVPERMKLDLSSPQATLAFGQRFEIDSHGAYLFGAPASGNRLLTDIEITPATNPLADKLPGFVFGDVDVQPVAVPAPDETTLDAQGAAAVSVDLPKEGNPETPYTARATMTLLESGGRPLVRSLERTIWPADTMLAVRPLFGDFAAENSQVGFEVVRVDREGHGVPANGLPVKLIRENRDFYWRFDKSRGWISGFNQTDELAETANVDVPANGRGKLLLPVSYGRYRIEIADPATHRMLRYRFSAGYSFDETRDGLGQRPDNVTLMLDKASYHAGDVARLTVMAPHHGEALLTVEGDRLLWLKRVTIDSDKQVVEIPISSDWQRHDLYVGVTVLRPGNAGDLVTPARALGLVPLPLARDERRLNVELSAPDKVRSETTVPVRIKVPGAGAQNAMVTLSAVDVGILNITDYKTPDPWKFFFSQLRYGADQRDVYGRVIEKMAGQAGRLKFGGDTAAPAKQPELQKVQLVDLFNGPIALDANGEATVQLRLPDFNGQLRLMAVVATADHFGAGERAMTVAAPLIAELNLPRFIGFDDYATLALDLHNLSGSPQKLKVTVDGDSALQIADGARAVTLGQLDKTTLYFALHAMPQPGLHPLNVKVDGQDIHIRRQFALQVEAPYAPRQVIDYRVLQPGAVASLPADGAVGLYPSTLTGHLLMSNQPPIDIKRIVEDLLAYPYGCMEQTVSTAYPYLYLDEALSRRFALKVYDRDERGRLVERSLSRMAGMQARNGGFSLWGGELFIGSWLSAYSTAFMQDAREQGFTVPDAMLNKALDYLLRDLQGGDTDLGAVAANKPEPLRKQFEYEDSTLFHRVQRTPESLAYEGFVLARAQRAPLAVLRTLYDRRGWLHSPLAKVQLGLALQWMGDNDRARTVFNEAAKTVPEPTLWGSEYGSEIRDLAAAYALTVRYHVQVPGADPWLAQVADKVRGSSYLSTQERFALFEAARGLGAGTGPWQASVGTSATRTVDSSGPLVVSLGTGELGALTLANSGTAPLYVTRTVSGVPQTAPASTGDFQFDRTLYQTDGKVIGARALKVGETVVVEVDVWPQHDYQSATALVVDRVPAGLELENLNLVQDSRLAAVKFADVDAEEAMRNQNIEHVEFRDDRFVVALRLGKIFWHSSDPVKLFYQARVVTPGDFTWPGVHAEDMYNANIVDDAPARSLSIVSDAAPAVPIRSEAGTRSAGQ
jgi:uncharacterized protein YfaS (alpha-2-macroglobulin family)